MRRSHFQILHLPGMCNKRQQAPCRQKLNTSTGNRITAHLLAKRVEEVKGVTIGLPWRLLPFCWKYINHINIEPLQKLRCHRLYRPLIAAIWLSLKHSLVGSKYTSWHGGDRNHLSENCRKKATFSQKKIIEIQRPEPPVQCRCHQAWPKYPCQTSTFASRLFQSSNELADSFMPTLATSLLSLLWCCWF